MIMLKIILDRKEPSLEEVRQHQNFDEILAAFTYQQKVNNPWRYWYYPLLPVCLLLLA
ncbi:MAG: hypothetical protein RL098_334 [Bacteroidota bacterium]|jgi:hypothetical protein